MRSSLYSLALVTVATTLLTGCGDSATNPEESVLTPATQEAPHNKLQAILERGTLRVGTTGDLFTSYQDPETRERSGFDIDLTRKLAADMGVEIEYVTTDWGSLVSGLTAGRYDITTGASYNSGRAQAATYTRPILRVGTVALVAGSNFPRFASWDTINQPGVVVAVRQGTMMEEQARLLVPQAKLMAIAPPESVEVEVLSGRADVAIATLVDAVSIVSTVQSIRISEAPLQNPNYVSLLVPQGDHVLLGYLDNWILAQEHSGYLDELAAIWHFDL